MFSRLLVLAVALPTLLQALEITIGDYELPPRQKRSRDRKRLISRRMESGDHEHVEDFVKGRKLVEAREDEAEDPKDKWTTVFTEWETTSQLFRQCTNYDNTVDSIFMYYANNNFTAMRFTPKDDVDTDIDWSEIEARTDGSTCITKAAEGNYAMAQHWKWYGWFFTSGFACQVTNTYYNINDGQKCETDINESVFMISKSS